MLKEAAINPKNRRCKQLQWQEFDIKNLWYNELGIMKEESYDPNS